MVGESSPVAPRLSDRWTSTRRQRPAALAPFHPMHALRADNESANDRIDASAAGGSAAALPAPRQTCTAHARERHTPWSSRCRAVASPSRIRSPTRSACRWTCGSRGQGRRFGGPGPGRPLSGALPRCAADGPVSRQRRRVGRDVATGAGSSGEGGTGRDREGIDGTSPSGVETLARMCCKSLSVCPHGAPRARRRMSRAAAGGV